MMNGNHLLMLFSCFSLWVEAAFANTIPTSQELGCMIECQSIVLKEGMEPRRVCEWEYRVPWRQNEQTNWVPVFLTPRHSGTLSLDLQCTSIFFESFPADEFASEASMLLNSNSTAGHPASSSSSSFRSNHK